MSDLGNLRGDLVWHTFNSRESLAEELATRISDGLSKAYTSREQACIAFSGGSTPKPLFKALQTKPVEWQYVLTTLVDERWVPNDHELSNDQFITSNLLKALDPAPIFIPLFLDDKEANEACTKIASNFDEARIVRGSGPTNKRFDTVVLGMGDDGHTASFFPDAENIGELVKYDAEQVLQTCISPASQTQRITWSLAALLDTQELVLHITGRAKRELFEKATEAAYCTDEELAVWPIRAMAYQRHVTLHIYYAD